MQGVAPVGEERGGFLGGAAAFDVGRACRSQVDFPWKCLAAPQFCLTPPLQHREPREFSQKEPDRFNAYM
jgi:hypothetical protein